MYLCVLKDFVCLVKDSVRLWFLRSQSGMLDQCETVGLIYQSNVETSADPSAQINLRQSSRVIYETFVWRQSHRTKDRTLINVAAENNRRLNITPLKTPRFRSLAPKVYDKE